MFPSQLIWQIWQILNFEKSWMWHFMPLMLWRPKFSDAFKDWAMWSELKTQDLFLLHSLYWEIQTRKIRSTANFIWIGRSTKFVGLMSSSMYQCEASLWIWINTLLEILVWKQHTKWLTTSFPLITDIDECSSSDLNTCLSNRQCINTVGAYLCSQFEGRFPSKSCGKMISSLTKRVSVLSVLLINPGSAPVGVFRNEIPAVSL